MVTETLKNPSKIVDSEKFRSSQSSFDCVTDKKFFKFSAMMQIELSEIESEKIVKKAAKSENVKIIERKLEKFGNYFGYLGEYFHLNIDAEVENVPTKFNFFVKSLPLKNLKQRKMLVETGIFQKETIIYEKLLLHLNELSGNKNFWCADGFLFRDDLLVLENLSLKGYKMLPSRFRFENCHVKATLKSLASFHASSIFYEETNGIKSIEKEFSENLFETSAANIKWYHAGLKVNLSNLQKFNTQT